MKKLLLILLCVFLFMIDNTLLPFLSIRTYYPSILLIFVMCYSIINGKWEGLWLGVFSGLLQDLYFYQGFGINALTNMITCVVAAQIGESLFKEKSLIPILATFFLGVLKYGLVYLLLYVVGQNIDYKAILYISLYGTFAAIFTYKNVYNLSHKPFMRKKWKF